MVLLSVSNSLCGNISLSCEQAPDSTKLFPQVVTFPVSSPQGWSLSWSVWNLALLCSSEFSPLLLPKYHLCWYRWSKMEGCSLTGGRSEVRSWIRFSLLDCRCVLNTLLGADPERKCPWIAVCGAGKLRLPSPCQQDMSKHPPNKGKESVFIVDQRTIITKLKLLAGYFFLFSDVSVFGRRSKLLFSDMWAFPYVLFVILPHLHTHTHTFLYFYLCDLSVGSTLCWRHSPLP